MTEDRTVSIDFTQIELLYLGRFLGKITMGELSEANAEPLARCHKKVVSTYEALRDESL